MYTEISNTANMAGTFDTRATALTDTIVTAMTDELSLVKTANKTMWADGNLIYTVVLTNDSTTLPFTGVTFTDTIDPLIATLVANSVTLNGAATTYTFDDTTGLLTVTVGDVTAPGTATIVFSISKK